MRLLEHFNATTLISIATGCGNVILDYFHLAPERMRLVGKSRIEICDTCEIRTNSVCDNNLLGTVARDLHYGGFKRLKGEKHYGCSCNLQCKTLSGIEICPLGKWFPVD